MTNDDLQTRMLEAARLVQAGRAAKATSLIQKTLQGRAPQGVRQARVKHIPKARVLSSAAGAPSSAQAATPDGQWVEHSFSNAAGTRRYGLHVPSRLTQPPALIVMLHGCTQDPRDFATGTRMNALAGAAGCLVLYPAQSQRANGSSCWNWFERAHQQPKQGEPSLIAGMTRAVMAEFGVDARRVYMAGLSAGGAMALVMATAYPQLYRAVGIHSGLAYRAAQDLPSALVAMSQGSAGARQGRHQGQIPPLIVFHGDQDTTVNPRNAVRVREQAVGTAAATIVTRGQAKNGHAYTRSVYARPDGQVRLEQWLVHGLGHAWSGGSPSGSFTDANGPDASSEMLRFFKEQGLSDCR